MGRSRNSSFKLYYLFQKLVMSHCMAFLQKYLKN
jgi:hypothetical protein